jgi:hypothetical protein
MIPVLTMIGLYAIGAGQVVAGVFLLAGTGWGLIALGAFTMIAAFVVARGMVA